MNFRLKSENNSSENVENVAKWLNFNKKIWDILVHWGFWITEDNINNLLLKQSKLQLQWVHVSLWDLVVRNKLISMPEFINFLNSSWLTLRLWELLFSTWKISLRILDKSLMWYYRQLRAWIKLSYWDYLVNNNLINRKELTDFLKQIRVKLRVWEILVNRNLISEKELSDLLLKQELLNNSWKNIRFLDLVYSMKNHDISSWLLKTVLLEQRLSVLDVIERRDANDIFSNNENWADWIVVEEVSDMSDEMIKRLFWASRTNNSILNIISQWHDDPWINEAYHSTDRLLQKN